MAEGSEEASEESTEKTWHSLSPDIQERILLQLPISAALKAACVCKQWLSIISSPSFTAQSAHLTPGKQPWFFLWGINELVDTPTAAFTFDPLAGHWFRLRLPRSPDFDRASFSGTNGLLFAFSGSKVCYARIPTKCSWKETPPAFSTRCSALIGLFDNPDSTSFKFVLLGGLIDEDEDQCMVEMYDSCSNTWELCPPMPEPRFYEGICSHWMCCAVLDHKLFVAGIYSGEVVAFDIEKKVWSKVQLLEVPDMVYLYITASEEGLYAVAVCHDGSRECLKLFKVDEVSMECEEVSVMSQSLFSLFQNEDEQKEATLRCVGAGNLVYVYSESYYKSYPVCMCELINGGYEWKQLPSLPHPLPFDKVMCHSTHVTPRACLGSLQPRVDPGPAKAVDHTS